MIAILPVFLVLAFFILLGLTLYITTTISFWRRRWHERRAYPDPSRTGRAETRESI